MHWVWHKFSARVARQSLSNLIQQSNLKEMLIQTSSYRRAKVELNWSIEFDTTIARHLDWAWESYVLLTAAGGWSPEFLSRVKDLSCQPGELKTNVTFLHGMRSGHFAKLGKVADMNVCIVLCCEINHCEAAFMAGKNCYAVTCFTQNHCATAPARNNKWQPMITFVKRLPSRRGKRFCQYRYYILLSVGFEWTERNSST